MKDFKIRVENDEQFNEIVELFKALGVTGSVPRGVKFLLSYEYESSNTLTWGNNADEFILSKNKEITLPKLRDLVILHRNHVNDATHAGKEDDTKWFVSRDDEYYEYGRATLGAIGWVKSSKYLFDESNAQPIQKEEKETQPELTQKDYVNKYMDGENVQYFSDCFEGWISLDSIDLVVIRDGNLQLRIAPKTILIDGNYCTKEEALKVIEEYFA